MIKRIVLLNWLLLSILSVGLFSCADNGVEPDPGYYGSIDINNPNEVVGALTISGAVLKQGAIPAASPNASAPRLYSDGGIFEEKVFQGKYFLIDTYLESGQVAGYYFQVKGADSYYDLSLSNLNNSGVPAKVASKQFSFRQQWISAPHHLQKGAQRNHGPTLKVQVSEELRPGMFCGEFAVYDHEGRVSNFVEVCTQVYAPGGFKSAFLTQHSWKVLYQYQEEAGVKKLQKVGENQVTNTYPATIRCSDGSYRDFTVEEYWRLNYAYLTLFAAGSFTSEASVYERTWNEYTNSTCEEGLKYYQSNFDFSGAGAWSYNHATKEYTSMYEWGDEYYKDIFVNTYTLKYQDGFLQLDEFDSELPNTGVVYVKK